ncbi:pyrroline-5-carboxylate reductase [bacterium]|nr:pyrroline-5-carboxylate reductase [bacterium]
MALNNKTVAFIGAGNMAEALIKGMLSARAVSPRQIIATDVSSDRLTWLREEYGIRTAEDDVTPEHADIVILAVKPQVLPDVLREFAAIIRPGQLAVSIAAGVTTKYIESMLPKGSVVVRAMPNTPALVRRGATAICAGSCATAGHMADARDVFRDVGSVIEVPESAMNAVTAVSGSGPAYVFYVMEAMIAAALSSGVPADQAQRLVVETVCGAGELALHSAEHPEELRRRVTSPGGTTEAAVNVFDANNMKKTIEDAIAAAVKRAQALAR